MNKCTIFCGIIKLFLSFNVKVTVATNKIEETKSLT